MSARCEATVVLQDDRWGAMTQRCELPLMHACEHSIEYTATEPRAHLRWANEAHPEYRIALRPDLDRGDPMDHGTLLDDIVVNDVPMFRAEDMGDYWWVCCYLNNETHDRICWSVRARKKGVIEWTTTEYPLDVTYEHALKTTVPGDTATA